ncbi:hypothetical protein JYT83_01410 [bacterium AH-315-F18]|nr:hypothetical protein [bacterium AH-315-F18]
MKSSNEQAHENDHDHDPTNENLFNFLHTFDLTHVHALPDPQVIGFF